MNVFTCRLRHFLIAFAVAMGSCSIGWAQVEVSHLGDWFYVEPGTDVYIKGSLISLPGNNDPLSNLGDMYISDSVTCDGNNLIFGATPDTITANVYLNGTARQTFTGSTNMRFGNIYIQNSYDSLRLENNVEVYNFMQIDSGNIDLSASTLDLLNTGKIIGENNDRRIFSGPYGRIHLNRPLLLGQTYTDLAGTGFGLTIDGNLGTNVDVWRGNYPQTNVSNGSIERYYFFNPQFNGAVSAPESKYWDANELNGNDKAELQFYQSSSNGVNWTLAGGVSDTANNVVESTPALNFVLTSNTGLTLAESECDSLPPVSFNRDTIAICGAGGNAWLVPNGITGMTSVWSTGIQNQDSIQVTAQGQYEVTITDLMGCPNTDSVFVLVAPVPNADFQVTPVCVGDSSQFQNQSTIASGSLAYHWDLNDVYTSNVDTTAQENPSIVYTSPGSYGVSLTATSARGCVHSYTATATVLDYPVADFSVVDLCEDSVLNLVNSSSITPAAGLTYNWDFGNGDSSQAVSPVYSYGGYGMQSISLEATSNGCMSSVTKSLMVHPNPVAAFSNNDACLGSVTNFNNSSNIATGSMSFLWDLGSGNSAVLSNPTFVFPTSGTQNITLTATSAVGCVHDTTIGVLVNALPNPSFSVNATCQGDVMAFSNNSPATSTFQWDFNGEGQSTSYNPGFTFNSAGNKTIVLVETDLNGCVDSTSQLVISKPAPVTAFNTNGNCEGSGIAFNNTSSTPSGSMVYQWDFGDLNNSTLASPMHTYAADGNYQVELVAENNGCFDTLVQTIAIDSLPYLSLGGAIATCDSQYVLDAGNPGSVYLWSNSSTAQSLTATYNGDFWVAVTNVAGCSNSDTVAIVLNDIVQPQLGADSTFCNSAPLNAGYPGASYLWNTGANTQSIDPANSGLYWVEVTDQNGCVGRDSIQATVVVAVQPDLGADASLCEGQVETLDPVNTGTNYQWSTGAVTATIDVTQNGTYWVDLEDANGCIERDSIQLIFNPNPVVDLGPDSLYCDSFVVDLSQANTDYDWSTGANSAIEVLTNSGSYSVLLTNQNSGCESRDTVDLVISATPIVELGNDTILCSGANLLLDAGNAGNVFSWNVGGTQQTQLASSSGIYAVEVISAAGCTGVDSVEIAVGVPLNTELGPDFTLCQGQSETVSSPIFGASYAWFLDGNQLSNTDRNLMVTDFGSYSVVVTDSIGCVATDTIVALETGSGITAEFLVSTIDLFAGDTLQFVNLSYPGTFNSYWSFGDGAFSIAEDPEHVYFAAGDYVATLEVDNGVCTSVLTKNLTIVPKTIAPAPVPTEIVINDFSHTLLYPNPNTGNFTVEVELLEEGELHITCIDMRGKVLFQEHETGQNFKLEYENLDVSAGIYLLNLRVSERSETIKFIKR